MITRSVIDRWARALALAIALLVAGCSVNPTTRQSERIPPIVLKQRALSDDAADRVLQSALDEYTNDSAVRDLIDEVRRAVSKPFTAGNHVDALIDGPQTYGAIEAAIRSAKHHIHIETFIFGADEVGRKFADLLVQKHNEGVEVRVLYDSIGSRETPHKFFDELRTKGLDVREFRPVNPIENPNILKIQNRDHRKIVVVDGRIGFTGGINIDGTYSSSSAGKPGPKAGLKNGWRDTHVRIVGPVVKQLQQLFIEEWNKAGDKTSFEPAKKYFPAQSNEGKDLVTIVANDSDTDDRSLYGTYLGAFKKAHTRLWITHAYFSPNDDLMSAMIDAAHRGVDVKLIVPGFTDSRIVLAATRATYTRLLDGGVHIYQLEDAFLHAKSVVIDDTLVIIGSANLDMRSFIHNDEVNAVVISRDFGKRMNEVFQKDLQRAREIDLKKWKHRSLWQRFKQFTASLMNYWF